MVHLSLPLRKNQGKQNGSTTPQTPPQPSPARQMSTSTISDQKPLTLKINVIKVRVPNGRTAGAAD
jgi:hypothetical protein